MTADPRLTLARPEVADVRLRDMVAAARYAEPQRMQVAAEIVDVRGAPDGASLVTQFLHGEIVDTLEVSNGLLLGKSLTDGYVGYCAASDLVPVGPPPTHRIVAPWSQIFPEPTLKRIPTGGLPYMARVAVLDEAEGYARLGPDAWVPAQHLETLETVASDFVAVAETLMGASYLWGGRSADGLDCSALVQLSLEQAGVAFPRDSDQQAREGAAVKGPLRRGDLVFWQGHVGIMQDAERLLHANMHHMRVVSEPLDTAVARIAASPTGPVTAQRRLNLYSFSTFC